MRRHHSKMVGTGMVLAVLCVGWTASARDSDTPVLGGDPGCVVERLGRVRIEVGNRAPDPRRGGHLSAVSYAKAFERLGVAAGERGAHAVILREHEADYFAKGARSPSRPTYVALEGLAVRLREVPACSLAEIDPAEFEREASKKSRANVVNNAGVSF